MSPQEMFSRFFQNKDSNTKKKKPPFSTLVILLVAGIGLMLLSHFYGAGSKSPSASPANAEPQSLSDEVSSFKNNEKKSFETMQDYAAYYEENLKNILDKVMGVSNVNVWITLSTSEQNVYEKDDKTNQTRTNEQDRNGGTRETTETNRDESIVIVDGGNGKGPLIVTKRSPIVEGVVVVADGVENPTVKNWIKDAASSVLNVPSYKVIVIPAKSKEDANGA
ncbi:stage III sporulation protein AG [Tuberibacillus calidus]|jgi:stage III sporulation protein AG|uniref:stage III sporulation protein AG n=1 Tax=Tuberibacillus calidus TaxID=340097 RepID=UPI0003F84AEB|nr:stage III sporulation protein AG [Tuberibacillus calidus]